MKALLVDDNTAPFPVEPSNGTTPIQCTPGSLPSGGGPIVLIGGDQTAASNPVGDGATVDVQTLNLDTTGLGIAAALIWCTGQVALTASVTGTIDFEVILDGSSIGPPRIGQQLVAADGTSLAYTMSGLIVLSEGTHTVVVKATTQPGTTAVVNPSVGEAGTYNSSVVLLFLAA